MKELTLKQKKEALKDMIEKLKKEEERIKFLCIYFRRWYCKNVAIDGSHEYMKTFPELLNTIERRLKRQGKKVYYSISGRITDISALTSGKIDPFKYRIRILKQVQKEVNK